jgi:hypothetical protein
MLGVEPGTAVRANPGSWKKISDPQDLVIFNQARKSSRDLQSVKREDQKVIPPSPLFFRIIYLEKPFFSLLQEYKKQENRDYRMESPFQHYSEEGKED